MALATELHYFVVPLSLASSLALRGPTSQLSTILQSRIPQAGRIEQQRVLMEAGEVSRQQKQVVGLLRTVMKNRCLPSSFLLLFHTQVLLDFCQNARKLEDW